MFESPGSSETQTRSRSDRDWHAMVLSVIGVDRIFFIQEYPAQGTYVNLRLELQVSLKR